MLRTLVWKEGKIRLKTLAWKKPSWADKVVNFVMEVSQLLTLIKN